MPMYNYREPGAYSQVVPNPGIFTFINLPTVPCLIGEASEGSYDPKVMYSQDDVVREYGQASIDNPLSLAGEIAFQHGARTLYCVRLLPAGSTSSEMTTTEVATGALTDEYLVIQDYTGSGVAVTATISDTDDENTAIENADIIVYSINRTYGVPVIAVNNLDGTYTLTSKYPGSQHNIYIPTMSDYLALGFSSGSVSAAPGVDGVMSASDFSCACGKISNIRTNVIVPITEGFNATDCQTIREIILTHVTTLSGHLQRMERIGLVSGPVNEGLFGGDSIIANIIEASIANASGDEWGLNSERMVYIAPSSAFRFDPINNLTLVLDGSFLAAALSGLLSSYDAAEPMTRKSMIGFLGLGLSLSRSDMNQLAANGITVIENVRGRLRVRHGLTTDTTSADTQEISVVRLVDYTSEVVRNTLEAIYVGKKLLRNTTDEIAATTNVLMKKLIEDRIIYNARNVRAAIDTAEPRQVNVRFDLRPIYPLNWIEITIALYDQE